MEFRTGQDAAKYAAGRKAVETYLRDGMRVGLGSGTTSHWFVRGLAESVREGLDILGVTTSRSTHDLATELGVPLGEIDEIGVLDVTIDGADEIDHAGAMIKGGGACLLWEKIVAHASRKMVCVLDDTKLVETLGAFPLPIEVIPFGWTTTRRALGELLEEAGYGEVRMDLRMAGTEPLVTDSGNHILDAHLRRITDKDLLAARLNLIPGVVENGLFVHEAGEMVIGHPDGAAEVLPIPLED
jgi:ribose 5-phosphate isomerase A